MSEFIPHPDRAAFPYLKQRRNGVWYIIQGRNGRSPRRDSLKTTEIREAEKRYHQLVGLDPGANQKITVTKAWALFMADHSASEDTRDRYQTAWRMDIENEIGHMLVAKVTPGDLQRLLDKAAERKTSRGTLLSENSRRNIEVALSAFFTWCISVPQEYRLDSPVKRLDKKKRARVRKRSHAELNLYVTTEEIDLIAAAAGKVGRNNVNGQILAVQMPVIVLLLPLLGLRISELLGLRVSDWHRLHGELVVERQRARKGSVKDPGSLVKGLKGEATTIGDKRRVVTLSPFASKTLAAYVDRGVTEGWLHHDGYLFPTYKGTPRTSSFVMAKLREAVKEAGIGRTITAHYFRHTLVSDAIKSYTDQGSNVNWTLIGDTLGHTPEVARKIYGHVERTDAIRREQARFAGR